MAVMRGTVVRVDGDGRPHVEVPEVGGVGFTFGPCETAVLGLSRGERVLVASLNGVNENIVVVCSLAGTVSGYSDEEIDQLLVDFTNDLRSEYQAGDQIVTQALIAGLGTKAALVHLHDDRYYTEAESDARFAPISSRSAGGASASWVRVATVNGGSAAGGGAITLLIAGQGNYVQASRVWDVVTLGQRGDNAYQWEGVRSGSNTAPWQYYVKQVSTWVFELWARRSGFDAFASVNVLAAHNASVLMDSSTSVDPALTALPAPTALSVAGHAHVPAELPTDVVYRLVHGATASTARPARFFIEWIGSVSPTNIGPNDTWVNTAL